MRKVKTFILFLMFAFSLAIVQKTAIYEYVGSIKHDVIDVAKLDDSLYIEIQKKAAEYEMKPEDARIDRVWKARPSLNGKKVDVMKSYEQMKKKGVFQEDKLVFQETEANVKLKDLPPDAIFRGHEKKQAVSFAINVAWGEEYIPDLLQTLQKQNIKVTFFLEGRFAKKHPKLVEMIAEQGHEIGNHSYSHPQFSKLGESEMHDEIKKTNEIIQTITGKTPTLFGPPSGDYNEATLQKVREFSMDTVMWSLDTVDWKNPNPVAMKLKIVNQIHPGAIVLMHPTKPTADIFEEMMIEIKQKGFAIIPISELISSKRQHVKEEEEGRESE